LRREFRPEPLEDRVALSTLPTPQVHTHPIHVVHPHVVVLPSSVTITARVGGVLVQPALLPGGDTIARGVFHGTGHAYGPVTYATEFTVHREDIFSGANTINTGGASTISTILGDVFAQFNGGEQQINEFEGTITENGFANGVTGPYTGWAGSYHATGGFNTKTSFTSLYVTITLHPPKPTIAVR
jgi:hypothetical protein